MLRAAVLLMWAQSSGAIPGGASQIQVAPPPPQATRTVQEALDALDRAKAGESDRGGRSMRAIPVGSPGDWFSPDDYPPEAIRASRTGRVVVSVEVDPTGAVVSCRVLESSGTDVLDQRTCDLAKARGRFNPATDAKGRPIASEYTLPVRWAMPDGTGFKIMDVSQPDQADKTVEVETTYDADGRLLTCRVLAVKGSDVGDPCKGAKIGQQGPIRWRRAGVGVAVKLVQSVTYHAEALP